MKPKIVMLLIGLWAGVQAQVPGTLSYQGILMQSDGITPITDGAHSIVFKFYTVSSGGSSLFSRTVSVTTEKGLYTCIIGGGSAPNAAFNSTEMGQLGSQQVYIGIALDGGAELTPRVQLTTSPYAYQAQSSYTISDAAVTSAKILDGTIVNADVNSAAAIAGTKVSPNFGSQTISTSGSISIGGTISGTTGGTGIELSTGNHFITGSPSPTSAEGAPGSEAAITIQRGATGGVKNGNTAEIKVSTWESGVNGRTSMEFWLSGLPNNENGFGSYGEVPVLVLHGDDLSGTSNEGRVGIGTLSPSTTLSVNGDANKISGGTWGVFSDIRLKEDIRAFTDGLNVLMKVQPKRFRYNGLGGNKPSEKDEIGIIAQEVQKISPYMITTVKQKLNPQDKEETDLLMYDGGSSLIYVMVNSIKEQQAEIEMLKRELAELKSKSQQAGGMNLTSGATGQ